MVASPKALPKALPTLYFNTSSFYNLKMTEPPQKRRRPDSRQMWDASDRHGPLPSREHDEPPSSRDRARRDDRDRGRDRRRYRSRSPRDSKGRGIRDDYRYGDRDERGGRNSKGERRGKHTPGDAFAFRLREKTNLAMGLDDAGRDSRDYRDRPRERSRERDRDRRRTRSRSPRREKDREHARDEDDKDQDGRRNRDSEKEKRKDLNSDRPEYLPSRSATPPVSFKVGGTPQPLEYEKMDIDGTTAKSKSKSGGKGSKKNKPEEESLEDDDIVVEDDGMAAMQAMMGFGGFGTTQQKKVAGNDVYAVRKEKKTQYRQYMNRVGGFNRPLSPGRD